MNSNVKALSGYSLTTLRAMYREFPAKRAEIVEAAKLAEARGGECAPIHQAVDMLAGR